MLYEGEFEEQSGSQFAEAVPASAVLIAPAPSPLTLLTMEPTTYYQNFHKTRDAINELFDNVHEMEVVGELGEPEHETAVWVYHINVV